MTIGKFLSFLRLRECLLILVVVLILYGVNRRGEDEDTNGDGSDIEIDLGIPPVGIPPGNTKPSAYVSLNRLK